MGYPPNTGPQGQTGPQPQPGPQPPPGYPAQPGPWTQTGDPGVSPHDYWMMIVICLLLGAFGVHRFIAGKNGSGAAMLVLTLTVFGGTL